MRPLVNDLLRHVQTAYPLNSVVVIVHIENRLEVVCNQREPKAIQMLECALKNLRQRQVAAAN